MEATEPTVHEIRTVGRSPARADSTKRSARVTPTNTTARYRETHAAEAAAAAVFPGL
jgi:hypothetical protein